jgi:anaerobic ribonucleoside-triphosphate reductase activating protein
MSELDSEQRKILEYVDFIVDGRFVKELKDPSLKFRGSSNQNIIDVKEYQACRII